MFHQALVLPYIEKYEEVANRSVTQLLDISPKTFIWLKKLDLEFPCIEVWLTDQSSEPLQIKDKTNITLVIN